MSEASISSFPMFPNSAMGSGSTNRFSGAFPDPYLDYASTQMPRSIYDVLRWCEFVWLTFGTYRMASQRVVRYFLTKIELQDASDDEKEKYETFLNDELKIMSALAQAGDDFMAYGNAFVSVRVPFRRYLQCPKCGAERPISKVKYKWDNWRFLGRCGSDKCAYEGELTRRDRRSIEADKLRIVRWSPHEIKLLYHPILDKTVYLWDIPGWFKNEIKKGSYFYLESTPWDVVEAIREEKMLRFNDDYIYHLSEPTVAGLRNFGWGIPRIMGNFKQAWYIQVLKRYNEAIALDYIIPFRVITPMPGTGKEADPVLHINMGGYYANIMQMLRMHRKDPTTFHALPFPVKMDMLGADGRALAPVDLLDKATDEFLNAQGIPAEMYRGTLQWQAMPVALRLFERTWVHFVTEMNDLLNWIFQRVSQLRNWENMRGRLQPVTLADDAEQKQLQLQLAASKQISNQTALAPFGINIREEFKRMLEEDEFQQELLARHQEEQAQRQELQGVMQAGAAQGGMPPAGPAAAGGAMPPGGAVPGMPAGGMPMGAGAGGTGVTPGDLTLQAEQIATQLLSLPYATRRGQMLSLKRSNETLHSLVVAQMEKIRGTARAEGGQAVLQQTLGQGAGM